MLEIDASPPELDRFLFAGAAKRKQANVVGKLRAVLRGDRSRLAELVNIFARVEAAGLLLAALPRNAVHWQAFDETVYFGVLEQVAQNHHSQVAGAIGLAALLELLQVAGEVVGPDLVQR